ncbi:MAG: hypothetical protein BWZ08_02793 [candidate division BRC1 bacterium ADurb.BinA292]|nr:MAG: hypothetical protein BWZ08_02793 [candidate division BRC1 bacterium ADurb.BinA292]
MTSGAGMSVKSASLAFRMNIIVPTPITISSWNRKPLVSWLTKPWSDSVS